MNHGWACDQWRNGWRGCEGGWEENNVTWLRSGGWDEPTVGHDGDYASGHSWRQSDRGYEVDEDESGGYRSCEEDRLWASSKKSVSLGDDQVCAASSNEGHAASSQSAGAFDPSLPQLRSDAVAKPSQWTKEYFTSMQQFTAHYQQHNAAAKSLREMLTRHSNDRFEFNPLHDEDPIILKQVWHEKKGTDFCVTESGHWSYTWQELLGQLSEASLDLVFGHAEYITHCSFMTIPVGVVGQPTGQACWWFVLHRNDGTAIGLHPEWSKCKFPARDIQEIEEIPNQPQLRKKKFKAYRTSLGQISLHFDRRRCPSDKPFEYVAESKPSQSYTGLASGAEVNTLD